MKTARIGGILLLLSFSLIGCKSPESNSTPPKESTTITTTTQESATFKDGILTTPEFKLAIKDKEIIKSPSEENDGLYITYELTNTSDATLVPLTVVTNHLKVKQKTATSLITLKNDYHHLDAFGVDDEKHDAQVEKVNDSQNELLPDKTIAVIQAYSLDNMDDDVEIIASAAEKELGSLTIKLSELERPTNPDTTSSPVSGQQTMPSSSQTTPSSKENTPAQSGKTTDSSINTEPLLDSSMDEQTFDEWLQSLDEKSRADYIEGIEKGLTGRELADFLTNKQYEDNPWVPDEIPDDNSGGRGDYIEETPTTTPTDSYETDPVENYDAPVQEEPVHEEAPIQSSDALGQ